MNISELKKGNKVVAFPYGIGEFESYKEYGDPVLIIFPHESSFEWYEPDGREYAHPELPVSCWPIDEAPKWVWEALGVEKPKKMVKKEFVRYCVLEGDSGKIFFTAVNEDYAKTWLKSAPHNNFVIAKAVFTYEVEE